MAARAPLVLLTRPLEDSRRVADLLEPDGIDSLIWPLTRVEPVAAKKPLVDRVDALVVTSQHGIRGFAAQSPERLCVVFCVGARTAETARALGFPACFSSDGTAEDLIRLVKSSGMRRLVYPRGEDVSTDLAGSLRQAGIAVDERILYRAAPSGPPPAPVASALRRGALDIVTIWSARNGALLAGHLAEHGDNMPVGATTLVGISAKAVAPLADRGFAAIRVAEHPGGDAMLESIRAAALSPGRDG